MHTHTYAYASMHILHLRVCGAREYARCTGHFDCPCCDVFKKKGICSHVVCANHLQKKFNIKYHLRKVAREDGKTRKGGNKRQTGHREVQSPGGTGGYSSGWEAVLGVEDDEEEARLWQGDASNAAASALFGPHFDDDDDDDNSEDEEYS